MRATVVAICIAGLFMLTTGFAAADGGAALDFQQEFVPPGETATATTAVWFGKRDVARLDRGPYEAYLLPTDHWIKPPRIPSGAIHVGTIEFTPPLHGHKGLATLSFTVPDVPSASYGVYYCNDPCRIAAVGDLTGGWIRIAEDAEESRLLAERERFEWKNSSLEWRLGRARKQIDRLTAESVSASEDATRLAREAENLREQLAIARDRDRGNLDPVGLTLAGLAGLLLGWLFGRRGRSYVGRPGSPVLEAERILERVP